MNGIRCAFEGRLSQEPEMRYLADGRAVLNVGVGVPDGRGGVEWLRLTLWEELAERMHERMGKGDQVYAEGRLTLGQWTGQDGLQRSGLNVSAWKLEVLGGIGRRQPAPPQEQDAGEAPVVDLADHERRRRIASAAAEGSARAASRSTRRR